MTPNPDRPRPDIVDAWALDMAADVLDEAVREGKAVRLPDGTYQRAPIDRDAWPWNQPAAPFDLDPDDDLDLG